MKITRSTAGIAASLLLCLVTLTGCGGDGTDDDTPSDAASQSPTDSAPSMDNQQGAAIQECLDAAGIDMQMPSGAPSDLPTDMPTDMPSDMPSGVPSGGANGSPMMNDPDVQAALEACGIELPTAPGGGQ